MYSFIDVTEQALESTPSVFMTINGISLDDQIPGYRTLQVQGRETSERNIETESVPGRDGEVFIETTYEPKLITVKYQLFAEDNETFSECFDILKWYLRKPQSEVMFSDDNEYTYIGTVESMKELPPGLNTVVASFEIRCSDPKKYSRVKTLSGGDVLGVRLMYPVIPDSIEIRSSASTNKLTITNGVQTISLSGSFTSSDTVFLDIKNQAVYRNGVLNMKLLDLLSDFENFHLEYGMSVTAKEPAELLIKYREVRV